MSLGIFSFNGIVVYCLPKPGLGTLSYNLISSLLYTQNLAALKFKNARPSFRQILTLMVDSLPFLCCLGKALPV